MYCSLFSHETGDLLRAAADKGLISSEYVWIAMSVHASHSDKKAISQQQRLAAQGGGHLLRDRGGPPSLPNGLICVTYELTNNVPQQAIGEGATIWTEALIAYAYNALRPLLERGANASDLRTRLRHELASTPLRSSGAEDQRANELDMSARATATRRARRARSQCNPRSTSLPLLQHRQVFSEFLLERFRARQESLRQGAAAASGDSAAAAASAASRLRFGISPAATSAAAPARSLPDTSARTQEKGTEEAASGAQAMQPEAFNASLAASAATATATAAALRSDIDGLLMRSRFNFYNRKNNRWNFVRLQGDCLRLRCSAQYCTRSRNCALIELGDSLLFNYESRNRMMC